MEIFDIEYDKVVKSIFCSGKTSYEYAINSFHPQIDKYYAQRKKMDEKFYDKLQRDITTGCIMPPVTVAIIVPDLKDVQNKTQEEIANFLQKNKEKVYILDGIQRLNTLNRAYNKEIKDYKLYFNLLIGEKEDRLLYRMITLNNGQKPMSARHQIEVLANNIFQFEDISLSVQSEKDRSKKTIRGAFNKDDIIKAYIAFMSESVNIDNQKIIESKMDELIAEKIIESTVTQSEIQFTDVIEKIENLISIDSTLKWFKQTNNLIGFCAAIGKSYKTVFAASPEEFSEMIDKFENAFQSFDISKIKLGHLRRLSVNYFISKYETMKENSQTDIEDSVSQASMLFL